MELKYSICYQDKEEIEYGNETLNERDARQLLQDFDFDSELLKPINFYSPSLDFIRLDDRYRLILSGLGDGKLESFMVMFIEPKTNYNLDEFDEGNYRGTENYTKELSIDESFEVFEKFISQEYEQLRNKLKVDKTAKLAHQPSSEVRYEYEDLEEPYQESAFENIIARVGGPLLSLFFGGLTFYICSRRKFPYFYKPSFWFALFGFRCGLDFI